MLAILTIGTADDRVDLLDGGWMLVDWTPNAGAHQGAFSESALADFRQMKSYRDVTVPEAFSLRLANMRSQNTAIRALQRLRRILRKAIDYWASDHQGDPVYLEAKSLCETETRYALIHDAALPQDSFPYGQPFTNYPAGMEELTLVVERGPWLENPPGEGTCLELQGAAEAPYTQLTDDFRPIISSDDAYASPGILNTSAGVLVMGEFPATVPYSTGIVFKNVSVPNSYLSRRMIVLAAHVTFTASASDGGNTCNIEIHGEDSDNAASFSSLYDFNNRPWTAFRVKWNNLVDWTIGNTYDTPDLSGIIGEITGRQGWVPGNSLALFFNDNKSDSGAYRRPCSIDDSVAKAPVLTVYWYEPGETLRGQESTCDGVFLANKNNKAQITDVYWYDASLTAWSTNLIGNLAWPYNLLPAAIANNDAIYFGIANTAVNYGPFCSLVFDIARRAQYTGSPTFAWQYWNGAWTTLVVTDNTGYGETSPFRIAGIHSVSWDQPADWIANTGAGNVHGIEGYFVRAIATIGGGDSITTPTQQNRDIYTVIWGGINLEEIDGDIPAMLRLWIKAIGSNSATDDSRQSNRLIMGLRSIDRGDEFAAYLNLVGEQNPTGVQIIQWATPIEIAEVSDPRAATGTWRVFNPTAARTLGDGIGIYVQFESDAQYNGTFRLFLRCRQTNGMPGYFGAVATITNSFPYGFSAVRITNDPAYTTQTDIVELLDLGSITIPGYPIVEGEYSPNMILAIILLSESNTPGTSLTLYDLVLIPVDEWACEVIEDVSSGKSFALGGGRGLFLDLDGIVNPKQPRIVIRETWGDNLGQLSAYRLIENAWPNILTERPQKLWMVTAAPHSETGNLYGLDGVFEQSTPYALHNIKAWRVQRYLSMRGEQ